MVFSLSRNSIRRQLILLTVLLVVAPLFTLGCLLPWRVFSSQRQEALRLHEEVANRAANEFGLTVRLLEDDIEHTEELSNLSTLPEDRQAAILLRLHSHRKELEGERIIEEISLLDGSGRERVRLSRTELFPKDDLRDLGSAPLFLAAARSRLIAYSPISVNPETNEPLLHMAVPFSDPRTGALRMVILAQVRLRNILELVTEKHFGKQGRVFVVDARHRVVAHPDPSVVLRNSYFSLAAPSGVTQGLNGGDVLYFARRVSLGEEHFFIVAVRPEAEAFAASRETLWIILSCLVFFLLVSVSAGRTFVGNVLRPLAKLGEVAGSVSGHDFSARAPETGPEEFHGLAAVFNAMLARLGEDAERRKQAEQALQQANTELDQRVAMRTAALNFTNTQLRIEISERADTEKRLRRYEQIVAAAHDLMSFIDRDLIYLAVNDAYLEYHGVEREKIVGHSVRDLHGEEAFLNIAPSLERALTGETQQYRRWFTYAGKGQRYAEVQYIPFREETGEVSGVVVNVRDITEQFSLEQAMRQADKLRAVGGLAAGIAHDFNNILNIIQGSVHAGFSAVGKDGRGAAQFTEIAEASRRAAGMVQQILAFSRPVRGEMKRFSLGDLVEETLALQKRAIPASITIALDTAGSRGAILADSAQVHQILTNLIANAVHAMRAGGTLTVTVDECDRGEGRQPAGCLELPPGRYTRLVVADTGCGMDEETLQHIFDPFFTTKEVGQGTGLGLAICQGIVQAMGGAITVKSAPGEGARIEVSLPLAEEEPEGDKTAETAPTPLAACRILFIDDEPLNLKNWQLALEGEGFTVTTCLSGEEALACFQREPDRYDLVITDQRMPQMSGTELAQQLLALRPELPVILCSGWNDAEDDELPPCIRTRLDKPLTIEGLLAAIARSLESLRA